MDCGDHDARGQVGPTMNTLKKSQTISNNLFGMSSPHQQYHHPFCHDHHQTETDEETSSTTHHMDEDGSDGSYNGSDGKCDVDDDDCIFQMDL
jgi:hypothetical protein